MVTGYSLLDSGFKTNAGTFFVTFKDFDATLQDARVRERAERARDTDRLSTRKRS